MQILDCQETPEWLRYPPEYMLLIEQNIVDFFPWYLLDAPLFRLRYDGLRKRYPKRDFFAFAARHDNDEVACWERSKPGQVLVLEDFMPEEFIVVKEFGSFWDWFRAAIEEMIARCDEDSNARLHS